MQILIPIAGHSPFFPEADYFFPKPLIEIAGKSMIELVISCLKQHFSEASFTFVIDRSEARSFSLDRTLNLLAGQKTQIVERLGSTSGPLCSCLLAYDILDHSLPLIISNSDQIITDDLRRHINRFQRQDASAGVITFDSVHPRWSYVIDDGNQHVIQASDEMVVSRNAIAGILYFKNASLFLQAAQQVIINGASSNGIYSIPAALNEVILAGEKVVHAPIESKSFHSFYSPSKISEYEKGLVFDALHDQPISLNATNVIIPAAGEGSRFAQAGWSKPKPFIDVNGRPMIEHVIDNVTPSCASVILLLQEAHLKSNIEIGKSLGERGLKIKTIEYLTEGTACTVLLARQSFDNEQPLLIANSDQLINFNINLFMKDCLDRDLDGSILVFRDPLLDPKWSFAKLDNLGHVTQVAEKDPISDLATVGIYLFTRGSDFVSAAIDMIAANDRVNGEFYTCPVYNYMIRNGARIGVYEIPFEAMVGLGTPGDLSNYLTLIEAPASIDAPK